MGHSSHSLTEVHLSQSGKEPPSFKVTQYLDERYFAWQGLMVDVIPFKVVKDK